jgi:ABC-type transport system involved in cytochrome c biogenesis permease subunit
MTPAAGANTGQVVLVIGAAVLFSAAGGVSVARLRNPGNKLRLAAKSLIYFGICLSLAAVIWRSIDRGSWMPLQDNFEALASLAILLAGFTLYVQRVRPIPGLDWFLMPIVFLMLFFAALFGMSRAWQYEPAGMWDLAHRASNFGGMAAFGVAAAVGAMYLIASSRLRRKAIATQGPGVSLERLEHLTDWSVSFGFALLTVGIITGVAKIIERGPHTMLGPHWMTSPKVILAFTVWLIYAIALHTPITPAIRGRKSAMLSIVGFVLMVATLMAVLYLPSGR